MADLFPADVRSLYRIHVLDVSPHVQGARSLFTGLFKALSDLSDLAAPVAEVSEESKMVFLVWRCPASGFMDATDTFVFGDNKKIYRQTVAFRTG